MEESEKMRLLKELLLDNDRAAHDELQQKVDKIQEEISDHDKLIDMLYPIIGKAIKKFIRVEIQILTEKIDAQFQKAFSWKGWKRRIKSWFTGTKESELILRDLDPPILEEMFVIENNSGLLKGSYSKNNTIDKDMIAGMLTAIKAFTEDAFSKGGESLEMIEYESYKIMLYSAKSFYIAVVTSGTITAEFKAKMNDKILDFIDSFLKFEQANSEDDNQNISLSLKKHFDDSEV